MWIPDADKTGVNVVDGCLNEALRGPVLFGRLVG
jgi:hypothetical protein